MINAIRHHLRVYRLYIELAYAQALSFRLNFMLYLLIDIFYYSTAFGTAYVIYEHTDTIGLWNRTQFMFFLSFMMVIDHFDLTYVTMSFWKFSEQLRQGTFDFVLLKPTNGIFTTFFSNIRAATIFNGVIPISLLVYFGVESGLSALNFILLPLLVAFSLALLLVIEILISLIMFWSIESWGINILRIQCKDISRWPDFIYAVTFRRIFTFGFPLLLIGSAPVRFLYDTSAWPLLAAMAALLALGIWAMRTLWRLGLRQYESASS